MDSYITTNNSRKQKLLFLIFHEIDEGNGVSNKIKNQIKAFRHHGFDVDFSYLIKENGFLKKRKYNNDIISSIEGNYHAQKYGYKYFYKELFSKITEQGVDIIYIRYTHFANPLFIKFLSKLKKKRIKVLLEIPTYPYDSEYKNVKFKQKLFLIIERLSRNFFKYYCDKIVTVSSDTKIFGTDTIIISNGINIDKIKLKKKKQKPGEYRLIGVANIRFWHGFDRMIKGLHDYYSDKKNITKVYFDIIGDSSNKESLEYRNMVKEYRLQEFIIFNGVIKTENLDPYFDKANLAVGSLGIHRIGLNEANPIKNREYCAKGIPFMYAMIDRDFDEKHFIHKVPDDDSNININAVIKFLEESNFSLESEREYAEEYLTWNSQIKKIIAQM
ncbi:MAG TPA: glycosyltransferase family 1 protein [Lutibacter sp.]|nr:glycosyltransferase family 1 protein [Lutibacter sp.]